MDLILKDIAEKLGLSLSTVSRVINSKPNVNAQTRERVLEFLKQNDRLDMISSRATFAMDNVVAVVIPDISENYFDYVVRGIENNLWSENIGMMLCDTIEDVVKEAQCMEMLISRNFSGIILATVDKDEKRLTSYLKRGVNIVFFDNLPNISVNYNSVITDNVKASVLAVNHLAALGHSRIGFISGKQVETTGFERLAGFRRSMEMNRLPLQESSISFGDYKEESGYRCMIQLLDENPDMTAVFVSSSQMSYGAMKALMDRGIRVPDDFSLIGFDVHDTTGLMRPSITTVMQNEEQIGRLCVDLLLRNRNQPPVGGSNPSQRILLEPRLVIRESCGHPLGRRHQPATYGESK